MKDDKTRYNGGPCFDPVWASCWHERMLNANSMQAGGTNMRDE